MNLDTKLTEIFYFTLVNKTKRNFNHKVFNGTAAHGFNTLGYVPKKWLTMGEIQKKNQQEGGL